MNIIEKTELLSKAIQMATSTLCYRSAASACSLTTGDELRDEVTNNFHLLVDLIESPTQHDNGDIAGALTASESIAAQRLS
jgi:hypothetical protein